MLEEGLPIRGSVVQVRRSTDTTAQPHGEGKSLCEAGAQPLAQGLNLPRDMGRAIGLSPVMMGKVRGSVL